MSDDASDGFRRVPTVADGLAAEARMLDAVRAGALKRGVLAWCTATHGLAVPARITRNERFARAATLSAAAGWPVFARQSGGGTVPQGPGVLNLALAFRGAPSGGLSVQSVYRLICALLEVVLARFGVALTCAMVPNAFCDGAFNLVTGGRKLAGTAQRWRHIPGNSREFAILVQASILHDLPVAPAVSAINDLHRRLGLDADIKAGAHRTLCAALKGAAICPDVAELANALIAEASVVPSPIVSHGAV